MIRGHRVERLDRHVPGEDKWEPHRLPATLSVRDRELREPRAVVGEGFRLRSSRVREVRRTADTYPNAPLLKRLVLYPYALHPDRVRRQQVFEGIPWDALQREVTPGAIQVFREARIPPVQGSPLRSIEPRRGEPRVRPSLDAWLASKEGR